jgi:hypothetical protein
LTYKIIKNVILKNIKYIGIYAALDIVSTKRSASFSGSIGITITVMMGLLGNSLYLKHVRKKIAGLKKDNADPEILKAKITKIGRTSWLGVGFALLLLVTEMLAIERVCFILGLSD